MSEPAILEILARLAIAVLCGGILGWEREWQSKPAGLRTHMLVALGSAGFTVATLTLATTFERDGEYQIDPLRVIEGVIGGIGFLGAGSIIQSQGSVKGITTAATIWVVGAIGVGCGIGALKVAGIITAFAIAILTPLGYLENRLAPAQENEDSDTRPAA